MRTLYALATLLLAAPVFGQEGPNTDGFYLGAGLGDFSTGIDDVNDLDEVNSDNLDFDPDNAARRLFAGWRFNRFLAVQLDWIDFQRSSAALNTLNVTAETDGVAPSVVGTLPLGPIELFARAGLLWYDVSIAGGDSTIDQSDRDPIYGAGIGATVAKHLNLRLEYERVDIEGLDDSHAIWLTAAWRF